MTAAVIFFSLNFTLVPWKSLKGRSNAGDSTAHVARPSVVERQNVIG